MDDAELLAATAAGDADAFAMFYRRHLARVVGFCLRETGSREAAADLAAEVFAAALESAGRYEPRSDSALPWLYGIARNKLLDSLRRGRVEDATQRRLGIPRLGLEDADLERVTELALLADDAVGSLSALSEPERVAIVARVVHERPYEEIAASLACSESVVRQRVSRGLARVRARLASQEELT